MQGLPFDIPRSLSSYLTQFESDPEKGIANLESHLKKRGMDAVGYFLLSWLYHNNQQQKEAIHYALKAKCCAPGSPLFEHLHYFLVHPQRFDAWKPFQETDPVHDGREPGDAPSGHTLDLDRLIEQLSFAENKKITISPDITDDRNLSVKSEKVGDIASETLAKIYEKQGRYSEAVNTLKMLRVVKPAKASVYDDKISQIERLMESGK
ncbi:hypothetical protein QA596_01510 [Balneolales bacterium ANBcel1]|nr:hypothetical protein [Balneolales bacterium ANBcel1]